MFLDRRIRKTMFTYRSKLWQRQKTKFRIIKKCTFYSALVETIYTKRVNNKIHKEITGMAQWEAEKGDWRGMGTFKGWKELEYHKNELNGSTTQKKREVESRMNVGTAKTITEWTLSFLCEEKVRQCQAPEQPNKLLANCKKKKIFLWIILHDPFFKICHWRC